MVCSIEFKLFVYRIYYVKNIIYCKKYDAAAGFLCQIFIVCQPYLPHRHLPREGGGERIRRIKTEEKAKFVAAVLGDRIDTIPCLR